MALISLRQMLDHAAEYNYGVPAFNVNNLEQMRAIMLAAEQTDSPVIVQASAGARKYAGAPFLRHLVQAAVEEWPDIPVCVHQDHGTSPAICQRSIQLGFTSVMMDGSLMEDGKTPSSYDYNVDVTRRTVEMAHACGVSVEGELGCLGSLETGQAGEEDGVGAEGILTHDQMLTNPEEAADFVSKTHCDALAIACGTSHGAYKFSRPPTGDILAIDRIKEIHKRIPRHPPGHAWVFLRTLKNGWPLSISTAAKSPRPTACPSSKSAKASNTACVKLISTQTCALPQPVQSVVSLQKTPLPLTRVLS